MASELGPSVLEGMCAECFEAESTISTKVLRQELGEDETMKLRFAGESRDDGASEAPDASHLGR